VDWSEFKHRRKVAVDEMILQLDRAEPIGLSILIGSILTIPIFIWNTIRGMFNMAFTLLLIWVSCLARAIISPFLIAYLFIDLFLISIWYHKELVVKLSGEEK
jgi:hypothetical protein